MLKKIIAGTACALVAMVTVVTPADAATATPTNVRAASVTPTTMTVRWDAVTGASAYRVQLSGSSTMSGATYHKFAGTTGVLKNLTPRKRYYFRVSVLNASGTRISAYTPQTYPSAVTAAVAVPRNLTVTAVTASSATLGWTPSEGASLYRISRASSSDFAGAVWSRTSQPSALITDLKSDTTYYFKVRVIRSDGTVVTSWTTPVVGKTSPAPIDSLVSGPVDLRVGSFNVMTVSGDQTAGNRLPWKERRGTVISQILRENVDVLGAQELSPTNTHPERLVDGENQFLDLKNGLNKAGGTFALTNENSYNCVNPRHTYKCVYQDQGASGGDRILYDTSTLALVSQGAYQFKAVDTVPYGMAYAVLRVKSTGDRFFFTNTHLHPSNRTVRLAQWKELIAKINELKGTLPVINVGDYNTQKFDAGTPVICDTMLPAMKAAGYGDVVNQTCATNPVVNPRAQRCINGWINSTNHFDRDVRNYSYPNNRSKAGNNIDWIFATNSLPVKEWKVVIDYDPTTLQVLGAMPSDHNMVRATITLP
jgi:endonuclease/exonuclease/phosphatase family metal-dependent hydrolase